MTKKRNSIIESLGVYLPPKTVSTVEVMKSCRNKLLYPLERLTGIKNRRMAGETEFSIDLAVNAVTTCMERSKYSKDDIDLIICCNISRYDGPDLEISYEPSTSIKIQEHFGMSNAVCFDISNACAGMFTGTFIANAFLQSGIAKTALVVSGEYISHLTTTAQFEINGPRDERIPCLTVGDSGAAIIMELGKDDKHGFHDIEMYTLGEHSGCCVAKPTETDAGGVIMLTDSVRIHAVAISESVKHVVSVLKKAKWSKKDLEHFLMHQTARSAISGLAKQYNEFIQQEMLTKDNMIYNLEERGNTSSTTHYVAVWDNIHKGRIKSGDELVFAIQASGITLGAAPYTFDNLPDRLRDYQEKGIKPVNVITRSDKDDVVHKRVRFESMGILPESNSTELIKAGSMQMAQVAAEECFALSKYDRKEIDILIHAGIYRDEFIFEPAIAALLAGDLKINGDPDHDSEHKTFAYDVMNGSLSFLNACYNAIALIGSDSAQTAMIIAAETENNRDLVKHDLLNIMETGSAVILDECPEKDTGFRAIRFKSFTKLMDQFKSHTKQKDGVSWLVIERSKELHKLYQKCILQSVNEILEAEGLTMDDIKTVFPPQISQEFVTDLSKKLDLNDDRVVNIANGKDYFTSSTIYSMHNAVDNGQVEKGDLGLIINVGTGVQVGTALYKF